MPVLSTFLKAPAVALMKSQDRNGLPIEAAGGAPATALGASSASGRRHAKLSKLNYWSGEGARTLDPDLGKVEMLIKVSCIALPAVAAVSHQRHSWGQAPSMPSAPALHTAAARAGPTAPPIGA